MSQSPDFIKLLVTKKNICENLHSLILDPQKAVDNEYKRKYKKYELILYSLGVAGKKKKIEKKN